VGFLSLRASNRRNDIDGPLISENLVVEIPRCSLPSFPFSLDGKKSFFTTRINFGMWENLFSAVVFFSAYYRFPNEAYFFPCRHRPPSPVVHAHDSVSLTCPVFLYSFSFNTFSSLWGSPSPPPPFRFVILELFASSFLWPPQTGSSSPRFPPLKY